MQPGDLFSISFHQGTVDFPYNLKIQVSKINNDTSPNYTYKFIALNIDNDSNPNIKFITSFFSALRYLQTDANFSGLDVEYVLPDENEKEVLFKKIIHVDNPIFDSLLVTGYIGEDEVVINSLSCPPQR
ncbi:MAG TPA: hypothetical protein V6D14_31595 [Coleofasciculaceae cyanobacterium]|jgi:hypothetical protein